MIIIEYRVEFPIINIRSSEYEGGAIAGSLTMYAQAAAHKTLGPETKAHHSIH